MFTATVTVTKTDDVKWWTDTDDSARTKLTTIINWLKSQPGYLDNVHTQISTNVKETKTTFDTSENYHNMIFEAHSAHTEFIERNEYNVSNKFVYDYKYEGE